MRLRALAALAAIALALPASAQTFMQDGVLPGPWQDSPWRPCDTSDPTKFCAQHATAIRDALLQLRLHVLGTTPSVLTTPADGTSFDLGTPVLVAGTASPAQLVLVLSNGILLGQATANGSGVWSLSWTPPGIGSYTITTAGSTGSATITVGYPAPSITSVTPLSGAVGTLVLVNGQHFRPVQTVEPVLSVGATQVTLAGSSDTVLSFTIPNGLASGAVSVSAAGGVATGPTLTVTAAPPVALPTITGLTPGRTSPGSVVTVTGTNFDTIVEIELGQAGTILPVLSHTSTTASFEIPDDFPTNWLASVNVAVRNAAGWATINALYVVPAPVIASVNPTAALRGAPVQITGSNFGQGVVAVEFDTQVAFNGVVAPVGMDSNSSNTVLNVTVPTNATSGPITVTHPGGTATGPSFTVLEPSPATQPVSLDVANSNIAADFTGNAVSTTVTTTAANTTLVACVSWEQQTAAASSGASAVMSSSPSLTWTLRGTRVGSNGHGAEVYTATAPTAGAYTLTWTGTQGTTGTGYMFARGLFGTAWKNVVTIGAPVTQNSNLAADPLAVTLTPGAGSGVAWCGADDAGGYPYTFTAVTSPLSATETTTGMAIAGGYTTTSSAAALTIGTSNVANLAYYKRSIALPLQPVAAPSLTVAVSPSTATVPPSGTRTFSAQVNGEWSSAVNWTVEPVSGCGSITAGGVYTAPAASASCTVRATSQADGTKSATAAVTVASSSSIVYPPTATSMQKFTQPTLSLPPLGGTVTNTFGTLGTAYDTTTTRVTDSRHHYSKTTPWNADDTMAFTTDGKIYDAATWAVLRTVTLPNEHKTWANSDANKNLIFGANRNQLQWVRVDASTGTSTVLKTYSAGELGLGSLTTVSYGDYEGNLSNDDARAVLIANSVRPFVITPSTGAIQCVISSGGGFGNTVSDATMSQDGAHVLVNWLGGYGIDAYNAATCAWVRKITSRNSHYDACVASDGTQVIAQPDGGPNIRIYPIASGTTDVGTIVYTDTAMPVHMSCRNTKRPGWLYLSQMNNNTSNACTTAYQGTAMYRRVFSVKLDGSKNVESYGWDQQACPAGSTSSLSYDRNPMAVPNRWGNKVWFKSSWMVQDGTLRSFVAGKQ